MPTLHCQKSFHPLSGDVAGKFALFVSCLLFSARAAFAVTDGELNFSTVSIADGLSQSTVLSITQDRSGNIWLATLNGLNRYDGYDFTVFRHEDDRQESISDSRIRIVFTDSRGNVWAGTENGLSIYDPATSCFVNRQIPSGLSKSVRCMAEIPDGKLLVGTVDSLYVFDLNDGIFSESPFAGLHDMPQVTALCSSGGNVYAGTADGKIFLYSPKPGEVREIYSAGHKINCIRNQNAMLWAGTEGGGLFRMNLHTGESTCWRHSEAHGSLSSNYVRAIETDTDGQIWIGTFNGLDIYSPGSGTFKIYESEPFVSGSLAQKSVRCIFRDSQGGIWLGTYFGGVSWWHPLKERFRVIRMKPSGNSLNDNIISCIVEGDEGELWIGTHNGGINRYNPDTGEFSHYMLNGGGDDAGGESEDIKAILIDGKLLYAGAHGHGLNVLDRRTGRMRACTGMKGGNAPADIYSLLKDDSGFLWIGSLEGLYRYFPENGSFEAIVKDIDGVDLNLRQIRILHIGPSSRLWVGSETGLNIFETSASGLKRTSAAITDSIGKVAVQSMLEDDEYIWIATFNGLFRIECASGEIRHYTKSDGLPDNNIKGIEKDQAGRLWLSTDCGLSCFSPDMEKFRNFTISDGLQSNEFNVYAHCRTASGMMYFGGIDGITVFNPERLTDNPYTPAPHVSRLLLFGSEVHCGDGTGIMRSGGNLKFRHFQNAFTVELSVCNFLSCRHDTFAYRLEGFDSQWNYLPPGTRDISFSNLPRGRYELMMKAANNDGHWSDVLSIPVTVRPVWYRTVMARVLMALFAVLTVVFVIWFISDRKAMSVRLELERGDRGYQKKADEEFMGKAVAIVEKNIDNPEFSVEDLASAMNMSRSTLHNRLKSLAGESALDFIRRIRFRKACDMLKEGRLPISEISEKVGFSSPSYFATAFKKRFGCHPSRFLKEE